VQRTLVRAAVALLLAAGPWSAPSAAPADAIVGSHLVDQARVMLSRNDLDGAAALYERAIEYRDSAERRIALARIRERQERYDEALANLRRASDMTPTRAVVAERLRVQRLAEQRSSKASAHAEERRERELAERQAAERRRRLAALRSTKGPTAPPVPPPATAPVPDPTSTGGVAATANLLPFVDGLTSNVDFVRRRSAQALADAGRAEFAPAIAELLRDDSPFVRMDAAAALAKLRSPATVTMLVERLFVERNATVQRSLVAAIEAEGSPAALAGLTQYGETLSPDAAVLADVQAAVARLGGAGGDD